MVVKYSQGAFSGRIMLWFNIGSILRWYFLLCFVFLIFAGYAYRVNNQLSENDPKKKDFHPFAVRLSPVTWPLIIFFGAIFYSFLAIGYMVLFVFKALLYGIFLVLFTIALVFIRKIFLIIWLEKAARKVGGMILAANTTLIKLFQIPWVGNPQ